MQSHQPASGDAARHGCGRGRGVAGRCAECTGAGLWVVDNDLLTPFRGLDSGWQIMTFLPPFRGRSGRGGGNNTGGSGSGQDDVCSDQLADQLCVRSGQSHCHRPPGPSVLLPRVRLGCLAVVKYLTLTSYHRQAGTRCVPRRARCLFHRTSAATSRMCLWSCTTGRDFT